MPMYSYRGVPIEYRGGHYFVKMIASDGSRIVHGSLSTERAAKQFIGRALRLGARPAPFPNRRKILATATRKHSARAMGSRRARRNPSPKHGARETFELSFFQGYAVEIGYRRELDGKLYKHDVETDAAELYLATHPVFGKCLVIVDPSGRTPLWK